MLNGCGSNDIALVSFSFSCSFWRVQRAETLKRDAAAEPDSWPCWKPHERHVNPTPIRQLFIEIYMGCVQEVLLQAWPNPCPNSDSDPDFDFSVYGSSSIWTCSFCCLFMRLGSYNAQDDKRCKTLQTIWRMVWQYANVKSAKEGLSDSCNISASARISRWGPRHAAASSL